MSSESPARSGALLSRAAFIVLAGVGAGAAHSWVVPVSFRIDDVIAADPAPPAGNAAAAAPGQGAPAPAPLGVNITLDQARGLFDQGIMFLDAREDHERGAGWIAGSIHLTAGMMRGSTLPDAFGMLDPAAPVVIYCGGGDCDASENLAILLRQAGFATLHIMKDGFPAWADAGLPVELPGGTP